MTILQSKGSQKGDSDDPPPKKKLKKSKTLIRKEVQPHAVNHPTTSSAPGPSHRRSEQRDIYTYLSGSPSYFTPSEPGHSQLFVQGDRVVHHLQLDKFDVGLAPRSSAATSPFPYSDFDSAAGPSQVKKQIYNPDCLEYYIYGPGGRSQHAKAARGALKRPHPDVNLIEVISSEDIVGEPAPVVDRSAVGFEGGSLLDDINNFDVDDKFGELEKVQQEAIWEDSKMHNVEKSLDTVPLMNGFDKLGPAENAPFGSRAIRTSPAAALSNLGNTCFLNSVLYTLRYAPDFAHNLHHLVTDMNVHSTSDIQAKKTASLGRNLALSSLTKKKDKDLSLGAGDLSATVKTKKQIVTEKLHGVYESMKAAEAKEISEPVHPESFLTALREVNPIFEGNQQQDAHELLVCLLDIFRETCQASARQAETRAVLEANAKNSTLTVDVDKSQVKKFTKNFLWKQKKPAPEQQNNEKNTALNTVSSVRDVLEREDRVRVIGQSLPNTPSLCRPFIENSVAKDFEGVMVLRTTCLQCENTTEKKEPFADICVPIKTENNEDDGDDAVDVNQPLNASEMYQKAVVTDEYLRDRNKYYCEECMRYNEARRSVRYQTLPRLLTLQLKRFSSTYGAMSKVTSYMPTPMTLSCFCEECRLSRNARHCYELYGVIMHLGPNMAGGHYITYVRMSDTSQSYRGCARDAPRPPDPVKPPLFGFFKSSGHHDPISLPLPPRAACRSLDCCVPRDTDRDIHDSGKYGPDTPWMACDDDIVKVLSAAEVESLLSNTTSSNATPYLLFYAESCTYG